MSIAIAVAMHKPYTKPEDGIYNPIHVGASLHPEMLPELQGDNTGDNISSLNPYFCELTALYWLWKNNDSDYKGLVHYRRYFASTDLSKRFSGNHFDRIMTGEELEEHLKQTGVILPKKRNYVIETIYSHYAHTLHASHLDETRKVLQEFSPEYVPAWDRLMQGRSASVFNMMIMDRERFDAYCTWLFPILFELVKRIDPKQYDAFHARYPGRISEFLLNVWVNANNIEYKTVPTVYTEPVNWLKKGWGFLKAKYAGVKYSKSI